MNTTTEGKKISDNELVELLRDRDRLEWLMAQNKADCMWNTREEIDEVMRDDS